MKQIKKNQIVFTAAILLFGIILFVPIKIPYSIKGYGKIVPVKKWMLTKGADGELIANTFNYLIGTNENYSVTQVNRGENIHFFMNTSIIGKGYVSAGDTIAFFESSQVNEQLVELVGELEVAKALMKSNISGHKEALIRQAKKELDFAKTESAELEKILLRYQQLIDKNLVSSEEYESASNKARLAKLEIDIATAKLEAMQSGAKKEEVEINQAKIDKLQNELDVLQKRINLFTIICPINGKITKNYSSDTLITVIENINCLALFPIKYEDCSFVHENQMVKLMPDGSKNILDGKVVSIEDEIIILNNRQTVMATVLVSETAKNLQMGMVVRCSINCEPLILSKLMMKFLNI